MHSCSCILLFLALLNSGTSKRGSREVSHCSNQACSPPMGNLATGRKLYTRTSCCSGTSPLCSTPLHPCPVSHPPGHMADDPFLHPGTWWASEPGMGEEEIRLDLEARFCLTHLLMVFRSPRPAAIILERSRDFAQTWEPLKLFARNCSHTFSLPDDVTQPGAPCTSRYSSATPCSEGEVVFRFLGPGSEVEDPYSPEAIALLTLTNLRIRLQGAQSCTFPATPNHPSPSHIHLKHPVSSPTSKSPSTTSPSPSSASPNPSPMIPFTSHTFPNPLPSSSTSPKPSPIPLNLASPTHSPLSLPRHLSTPQGASFAVYTLLAGGTCLCHGHAEQCLPLTVRRGALLQTDMVHGRCICLHHTAGEHCDKCAPLYNDQPWRPANGSSGEPNPCQKCECHGHADTCHFSWRVWRSTGGISGGTCDNCRHNTEGRRCQRCRPGYHRLPATPLNSPNACTRCWCDPVGSVPGRGRDRGRGSWCHPRTGHCQCRPGVGGTSCNHCRQGHWGFGIDGCKPCECPHICDPITGHCLDSDPHEKFYNIPVGGKIPEIAHSLANENERVWSEEVAVSALHHVGKCSCKEKLFRNIADLCKMKFAYVIKATVLSAHDKGSHAEVRVKVRKVLRSGQVSLSQGSHILYPLSWTSRGCTCPILNPGVDYLLAGPEEAGSGRLLVTMQSVVVPWTPVLGVQGLRQGCP